MLICFLFSYKSGLSLFKAPLLSTGFMKYELKSHTPYGLFKIVPAEGLLSLQRKTKAS